MILQQFHIYTQGFSDSKYQTYWLVLKFWLLAIKYIFLNIKYIYKTTTLWLSAFDKLNIPKNNAMKTMLESQTGQKFSKAIKFILSNTNCYQPQK